MEMDLARLRAFATAIELGSLDAAAKALRLTPSAVSQRIRALEADAGRVLLVRSRPVTATEAGEELLLLARQVETLTAAASARIRERGPLPVTIAVSADSLATWVLPALAPLAQRITFRFERDDEEHTHELLRSGRVMAAIGSAPKPVQGCDLRPLGAMRYRPCAAPAFAAQWFGRGVTREALARAPFVEFDRRDTLQRRFLERFAPDSTPPRHQVPGSADFVEAVRLGWGWGCVPELQAQAYPDELVPVGETVIDVQLHWQQWRLGPPELDLAAEAIREAAARALRISPA